MQNKINSKNIHKKRITRYYHVPSMMPKILNLDDWQSENKLDTECNKDATKCFK